MGGREGSPLFPTPLAKVGGGGEGEGEGEGRGKGGFRNIGEGEG